MARSLQPPGTVHGPAPKLDVSNINTILLADDEPDIRIVAEMSLAQVGGWKVVLASNGKQAVEMAKEHAPDLIMLDVMMPEMDGVAAFETLAKQDETREIPVIFMTAKVQNQERGRYLNLGAVGVIAKPFDPMQLPETIRKILSEAQSKAAEAKDEGAKDSGGPGGSRMAALRARYTEKLGGRLDELRTALDAVEPAEDDEARKAALHQAYTLAHKLHGTAGTYGHQEVSRLMGKVEAAILRLGEVDGEDDRKACWVEIDENIKAARG